MKLFRRFSALVMALVLVLSLSIGVLAADFDNMADGFAYDGEDTEVNINLGADDFYGYYEAKEGKTYNVSSDNNSSLYYSSLGGSGTVNIDGAVVKDALEAEDQVNVNISGDVDAYLGLYTYDQSNLTLNGDITGSVVTSDQSVVTVNGDVISGVYAHDQSKITVTGNVEYYIYAEGHSEVTLNSDIDAAVDTYDYAKLTVNGDVNNAVYAGWQAEVTVNGDVNGRDGEISNPFDAANGHTGIYATGEATVTVTGNVSGGDGYGDYCEGGTGIYASDGVTITVGGNVSGGSVNGDNAEAGNGIFVADRYNSGPATISVGGTVTGGTSEKGTDADGIYIELAEGAPAPSITASGYDSASGICGVFVEIPDDVEGYIDEFVPTRDLMQAELDEIITVTGSEGSSAGTAVPYYGTSFYYSRGRLINEHGVSVRALFAFGNDWEETVENGTVTITSAEKKGEIVVTVESLKVMMDVGIETILFNGTKLVLKDAVAERSAYDTYTITASAVLLNGEAI